MSIPDWRIQPLRNFWQGVNWENRPLAPISNHGDSNNGQRPPELSFLMSVRDYFRAVSWTGIPEIAASTFEPKPAAVMDDNNETLENFLDDISNFF